MRRKNPNLRRQYRIAALLLQSLEKPVTIRSLAEKLEFEPGTVRAFLSRNPELISKLSVDIRLHHYSHHYEAAREKLWEAEVVADGNAISAHLDVSRNAACRGIRKANQNKVPVKPTRVAVGPRSKPTEVILMRPRPIPQPIVPTKERIGVVQEVYQEKAPFRSSRLPAQSSFPVVKGATVHANSSEPSWKQAIRSKKGLTLNAWYKGRISVVTLTGEEFVKYWKQGWLEFQQKKGEKPAHLPSLEEMEEFLAALKMPA